RSRPEELELTHSLPPTTVLCVSVYRGTRTPKINFFFRSIPPRNQQHNGRPTIDKKFELSHFIMYDSSHFLFNCFVCCLNNELRITLLSLSVLPYFDQ